MYWKVSTSQTVLKDSLKKCFNQILVTALQHLNSLARNISMKNEKPCSTTSRRIFLGPQGIIDDTAISLIIRDIEMNGKKSRGLEKEVSVKWLRQEGS